MPTHQSLSGASDEQLLQRMVATHPDRFGPAFWDFFSAHVKALPPGAVAIDLGCGPGLFLRDLGARYPTARLYGYDVTPAMIAHGQEHVAYGNAKPTLAVHDVAGEPLPHASGSARLVTMSSVLHVFDEPLPVLGEIRRVLGPGGLFVLNDWTRQPLEAYLRWRREAMGESDTESRRRGFRLFPVHAKYTIEDWRWLLAEAGFTIRGETELRASHRIFVTAPTSV
jgi:ubiquinone/menaquinone biosynthesis C-methylase UbiE